MFRRTKHYALTAPMECLLSKGQQFFTGKVVNMSLHGAFVAETAHSSLEFISGDLIGMNLRLLRLGAEISSLEVNARVVWRSGSTVPRLPNGLGVEFIHDEHTLRDCVAMISELCRHDVVKQDDLPPTATLNDTTRT